MASAMAMQPSASNAGNPWLQNKIESLDDVERAFVHVDYRQRDLPEHKVERMLLLKSKENSKNAVSTGGSPRLQLADQPGHSGRT